MGGLAIRLSLGPHPQLLKEDKTKNLMEGQIHLLPIISCSNNRQPPIATTVQDIKYHEHFQTATW